ncbi:hypothetical protein [Sorangium sp. So ce124]|uniref:hypothetical protein n=1 Tax=Sorangium sp. So ce124 TaxID=3133280 RepID=UPI003F5D897E
MIAANPKEFERRLINATRRHFGASAQVLAHQSLWESSDEAEAWQADLMCIPNSGPYADRPHIVEFKYTRNKTIPSPIIIGLFDLFERIDKANAEMGTRFAIVTNAIVSRKFLGMPIPGNVSLFEEIVDEQGWVKAMRQWLVAE